MENSLVWKTLRYHEASKHSPERYADGPGAMDWASQPAPFRFWEGATPVLLPLLAADPELSHLSLYERHPGVAWDFELQSVAAFLELSLGLSAWKVLGSHRWALRMNPSSGNLHPTEAHLVLPPLMRWSRQSRQAALVGVSEGETQPGIFHYNPYLHALEPRAALPPTLWSRLRAHVQTPGFWIGLTSVAWRESWKYGERALRYCYHDTGHALAALSFAANLFGWKVTYLNSLGDDDVQKLLGLTHVRWPDGEAELPEAACYVSAAAVKAVPRGVPAETLRALESVEIQSRPSTLGRVHVEWPLLEDAALALKKPGTEELSVRFAAAPLIRAPSAPYNAAALIRRRRSAVSLDGVTTLSRAQFFAILDKTWPRNDVAPFDLELGEARVHLLLFVHRVLEIESGVYVMLRNVGDFQNLQRSCARGLAWTPIEGPLPLFQIKSGSWENEAARLSCHQPIAGRGAFSLGMIAPFRPLVERAPWTYKQLFWECGQIGQALYLEAEAQGVRGTGIGCFFDDAVHEILGIQQQAYQSLYHFTIGSPVEDARLATVGAYDHLPKDRQPA